MKQLKYYRWTCFICLLLTYLSFIRYYLADIRNIYYLYIFYGSSIIFIIVSTVGVIIFSKKFGRIAYFLALLSFIGWYVGNTYTFRTFGWIAGTRYFSIQGETFMVMFFLCLIASIIIGTVSFIKGEGGIAKFSGVLLLLLQGILYVCMFITWMLSGGGF